MARRKRSSSTLGLLAMMTRSTGHLYVAAHGHCWSFLSPMVLNGVQEESRLFLKQLYGAEPDDNVYEVRAALMLSLLYS